MASLAPADFGTDKLRNARALHRQGTGRWNTDVEGRLGSIEATLDYLLTYLEEQRAEQEARR